MGRSQHALSRLLLAGAGAALLLSAAGVRAESAEKVQICHYHPGNPENVQLVSISADTENPHVKHHTDFAPAVFTDNDGNVSADCFIKPADLVAIAPTTLSVLACIERPGKSVGRIVKSSLIGLIHSDRMGCERAQ
jgi:hypothetical protein